MKTKLTGLFLSLLLVLFGLVSESFAQSPEGTFTLTSPTNSISKGSEATIVLSSSSEEPINAIQATLSYPANKLTFVKIDTSGTGFPIIAKGSGGNGTVHIAQGTTNPVTGNQKVASITFKALETTNPSEITLIQPTLIASANTNSNIFKGTTLQKVVGEQVSQEIQISVPPEYLTPAPQNLNVTRKPVKQSFFQRIISFFRSIFGVSSR